MAKRKPLFADEKTAADLFCMKPAEFRGLVERGHLPPAQDLGGFPRWHVETLERIATGEAIDGGEYQW